MNNGGISLNSGQLQNDVFGNTVHFESHLDLEKLNEICLKTWVFRYEEIMPP